MACSYNGYYSGLSIRIREFDSPTGRQVFAGVLLGEDSVFQTDEVGSNPTTRSRMPRWRNW